MKDISLIIPDGYEETSQHDIYKRKRVKQLLLSFQKIQGIINQEFKNFEDSDNYDLFRINLINIALKQGDVYDLKKEDFLQFMLEFYISEEKKVRVMKSTDGRLNIVDN